MTKARMFLNKKHTYIKLLFLLFVFLTTFVEAESSRTRLNQIAVLYKEGEFAKVIIELNKYLSEYKNDDLAWVIQGNAYEELEQIENAQKAYHKALEINPNSHQAWTGLGIIERGKNNLIEAEKCYKKSIEINPNYAQAYSSIVVILLKRKNYSEAIEYGKKGYQLDKKDPVIAANLAVAYHYAGDLQARDQMTEIAKVLGYRNMANLAKIYDGTLDVRD